jgi:hypothetical protein
MPTMPDSDPLRRAAHDAYHAPSDADIHEAMHGPVRNAHGSPGLTFLFKDAQPGSREHLQAHLVGSAAPEPYIERMDAIGPEGFGVVELLDGRSGARIARVNRHARRHLDAR